MITTRFIGRLGNSMFEISAIIAYARKYGYQWGVPSDARESTILKHFPNLPRCNERYTDYPRNPYDAKWYNYWDIPDYGDNITLAGYFQSLKFFEPVQDEVKKVFALNIDPVDACSIHVRRGDYVVHNQSFPPVTIEYIHKAMNQINAKTGQVNFFVFSDDPQWCKDNIKSDFSVNFFEGGTELMDLSLMASCKHHIIANSTFSWWGSYLGHNENKVVISPSKRNWFGTSNPNYNPQDVIPDNWIQIEY